MKVTLNLSGLEPENLLEDVTHLINSTFEAGLLTPHGKMFLGAIKESIEEGLNAEKEQRELKTAVDNLRQLLHDINVGHSRRLSQLERDQVTLRDSAINKEELDRLGGELARMRADLGEVVQWFKLAKSKEGGELGTSEAAHRAYQAHLAMGKMEEKAQRDPLVLLLRNVKNDPVKYKAVFDLIEALETVLSRP